MEYSVEEFLALIEDANADECKAIQKYFLLVDAFKRTDFKNQRQHNIAEKLIRELIERIVPEEMEHRLILAKASSNLSLIEPEKD